MECLQAVLPEALSIKTQKEAVSMAVVESCEWSHVTGCLCGESGCTGNGEPVFRDLGHTVWPAWRGLIVCVSDSAVCSSG